jgi:hypothetical protein
MKKLILIIIAVLTLIFLWIYSGNVFAINYIQPHQISTSSLGIVGTPNQVLTIVGNSSTWANATGGTGSGLTSTTPFSAGYIPLATTTNSLTNSNLFQLNQNIGIGTSTPGGKLDVYGGNIQNFWTAGPHYYIGEGVGTNEYADIAWNAANNYLSIGNQPNNETLVIKSGNVGIGTTNPDQKLHINGANTANLHITDTNTGSTITDGYLLGYDGYDSNLGVTMWNFENGGYRFGVNNAVAMTIQKDGNVGIGTTTPTTALYVIGASTFSGNVSAGEGGSGSRGIYLGTNPFQASLLYNSNSGNLDITPRSGYSSVFTAGNVGIGTTTPSQLLSLVKDSVGAGINIQIKDTNTTNPSDTYFGSFAGSLLFQNNTGLGGVSFYDYGSNIAMKILKGGNVGIGTIQPSSTLHVIGTGIFSTQVSSTNLFATNVTTTQLCLQGDCKTAWPSLGSGAESGWRYDNGLGKIYLSTSTDYVSIATTTFYGDGSTSTIEGNLILQQFGSPASDAFTMLSFLGGNPASPDVTTFSYNPVDAVFKIDTHGAGFSIEGGTASGTFSGDGSALTGLTQAQISGLTTADYPNFAGITVATVTSTEICLTGDTCITSWPASGGVTSINGLTGVITGLNLFNATTSLNGLQGTITGLNLFNTTTTISVGGGLSVSNGGVGATTLINTAPNYNTTTSINTMTGAITGLNIYNTTTSINGATGAVTGVSFGHVTTTINGAGGAITGASLWNTTTSVNGLTGAITGLNIYNVTSTRGNLGIATSSYTMVMSATSTVANKFGVKKPFAYTISKVSCWVDAATSETIQLQERAEGTPNTAGTDVLTSVLACGTTTASTTAFANAPIAANAWLTASSTAFSGTPNFITISVDFTYD